MKFLSGTIYGWSIKQGDFQSEEDDYVKRHQKMLRREIMKKKAAIVAGFSSALIVFMGIMYLITGRF